MTEDCPFCDERKIASTVEHMYGADGSDHMVFEPLSPVRPGHLLVVPVLHVQDATEDPLVYAMASGVAARVAARYRASNVLTSVGTPATQSVFHLHVHVVPRTEGDGLSLPWTHNPYAGLKVKPDLSSPRGFRLSDYQWEETALLNEVMGQETLDLLWREGGE